MREIQHSFRDPEASPAVRIPLHHTATPDHDYGAACARADAYGGVVNLLKAALMECASPVLTEAIVAHPCFARACAASHEDLCAFVSKDPAQHGSPNATLLGSTSFKAVLHYRLAHALITAPTTPLLSGATLRADELESCAWLIFHRGKLLSGADIHPRSMIGRRFVLDHGWGSVVGETSVIGNDCYMLGGVTLGATGIATNAALKRHPTLGNRVQIGAFARIFGDIHIGDDVFIGTHCSITHDIAANSIVTVRSDLQIIRERAVSAGV